MPLPYISIDNFRAFKEKTEFEFAPITILTGTNSSGKSSLTKAILLWKKNIIDNKSQSDSAFSKVYKLAIDSSLNIGNYNHWINDNYKEDGSISFTFPFNFINVLDKYSIEFTYSKDNSSLQGGSISKIRIYNNDTVKDILFVDDSSIHFDIAELWKKLEEYSDFYNGVHRFVANVSSNIDFTSFGEISNIENVINWFLVGGINYGVGNDSDGYTIGDEEYIDYEYFYITLEQFRKLLNKKDTSEFDRLKIKFELLLSSCVFSNKNDLDFKKYGKPIVNVEFPLLTYDVVNNPINDSEKVKHSDNIEKTEQHFLFSDEEKKILWELQKLEIDAFSKAMQEECITYLDGKEGIEIILDFLNRLFNNVINGRNGFLNNNELQNNSEIPSDVKNNSHYLQWQLGWDVYPLINELIKNKFRNENFPKEWILDGERKDIFCKKYNYSPNGDNLINNIILDSFKKNLDTIATQFSNIEFIPAFRNPMPERFYTPKDNNNFFSIEITTLLKMDKLKKEYIEKNISRLMQLIGIAEKINFDLSNDVSTINVYLYNKKGTKINIADFGHGISQLIPVILKIALSLSDSKESLQYRTIIIEEPETNLHPALQSKLADMFVEANKMFGVQFIIETHSEYLIRKLQYLTAKAEIKPEDTQIYYFYHPDDIPDGEPQVKKINISEGGILSDDFGTGFFDEADKIAMSIWSMNQSQKN